MSFPTIPTRVDYEEALAEIERLFDAAPGTPESDHPDVLTALVEAYGAQHYPIIAIGVVHPVLRDFSR